MLRRKSICGGVAVWLCLAGASAVLAQTASPDDAMLNKGPPSWDANHDGVYTCDEWKAYMDRLFKSADRNHDGKLDPSEFATVQKADATLADADFGYFDENQDDKITRSEFVEKQSPFILRFDANGDCASPRTRSRPGLRRKARKDRPSGRVIGFTDPATAHAPR